MSDERPRLLVLAGKVANRQHIIESLSQHFAVDVFEDVDAAMTALRSGELYYAVFADVGDFLPLERALVGEQAALVLNTIGEGVCVVDAEGQCVWANDKMRSFPPEVYDRVKQTCISAHTLFAQQTSTRTETDRSRPRSRKFGFSAADDRYFEAIVSPVVDEQHRIGQVVAVVWDSSSAQRLQQKIDAIDAAGNELVRLEADAIEKLNATQRLDLLQEKIIRYTSDLMHFDHFNIRLLDKRSNKLEVVMAEGMPSEAQDMDLYAHPEGNGISGFVAATGRSYICHDIEKDPRYIPGLTNAKSSLTVPLRLHDRVVGVFNIESKTPGTFTEDDRQFAEIFGRHIALALNILDLLIVERRAISGRMADNVINEIAAPLNDIVTEAQTLMEEYIGNDEMRQRLNRIVDGVASIREAAAQVGQGTKHILGARKVEAVSEPLLVGKRVLVADDEPNIRQTMASVLAKCGCEVIVCKDGHEAVNVIDQQPPDLVISDIRMPHRNGYEIFAAARRKRDDMPVILVTGFGYDPHHSIVRASSEGLQAVLFKPFKIEQLLDEVRKSLGQTEVEKPS